MIFSQGAGGAGAPAGAPGVDGQDPDGLSLDSP